MLAPSDLTPFLLERLQSEYQHRWIGPQLLSIAGSVRELGGNYDDYDRLVRTSNLWLTYTAETTNSVGTQEKNIESAWSKSADHVDWELDDALADLQERIRKHNKWPNPRTASRDRLVALAFVAYCRDRNCYTRTLSQYELAKLTGLSQQTVGRAMASLMSLGLLIPQDEHLRTGRKTRRYRLHLRWEVSVDGSKNTCIRSLIHDPTLEVSDVWSRRGLGQSAARVYEVLTDDPKPLAQIVELLGMSRSTVVGHLGKLFDVGLAGHKQHGRSKLWFRGDAPLDLVAEVLGVDGTLSRHVERVEIMQADQSKLMSLTYKERQRQFQRRKAKRIRRSFEESITAS